MNQHPYTYDDLESDLWHLYHQLNTVVGLMQEAHHDRPHHGAHTEQDRADALAWIARDMAERAAEAVSAGVARRAGGIDEGDTPVMVLFGRWTSARDEANGDENAGDNRFDRANAIEKQLLATRAETMHDLAAKLIAATDHGAYMDLAGFNGGAELVREAAQIVGRVDRLEGGIKALTGAATRDEAH